MIVFFIQRLSFDDLWAFGHRLTESCPNQLSISTGNLAQAVKIMDKRFLLYTWKMCISEGVGLSPGGWPTIKIRILLYISFGSVDVKAVGSLENVKGRSIHNQRRSENAKKLTLRITSY